MIWFAPVSTSKFAGCPLMLTDMIILFRGPYRTRTALYPLNCGGRRLLAAPKIEIGAIVRRTSINTRTTWSRQVKAMRGRIALQSTSCEMRERLFCFARALGVRTRPRVAFLVWAFELLSSFACRVDLLAKTFGVAERRQVIRLPRRSPAKTGASSFRIPVTFPLGNR